jgi:hypothetical protein
MSFSGFREATVPQERAEMQMTDESVIPVPPRPLTVKAFGIRDRGKVRSTSINTLNDCLSAPYAATTRVGTAVAFAARRGWHDEPAWP